MMNNGNFSVGLCLGKTITLFKHNWGNILTNFDWVFFPSHFN